MFENATEVSYFPNLVLSVVLASSGEATLKYWIYEERVNYAI